MRIRIDSRTLVNENYTGIARCVFEDVREWIELYSQHEFHLFSSRKLEIPLIFLSIWHVIDDPQLLRNGKIWFITKLPYLIRKYNIEVFGDQVLRFLRLQIGK